MCVFLMGWFDVDMNALAADDRSRIEVKKMTIDKEVMMCVFNLDIFYFVAISICTSLQMDDDVNFIAMLFLMGMKIMSM